MVNIIAVNETYIGLFADKSSVRRTRLFSPSYPSGLSITGPTSLTFPTDMIASAWSLTRIICFVVTAPSTMKMSFASADEGLMPHDTYPFVPYNDKNKER